MLKTTTKRYSHKPSKCFYSLAMNLYIKPFNKKHLQLKVVDNRGELKPPYIVLCNHASIQDYRIVSDALYPTMPNFVVAYDRFITQGIILDKLGCIRKRQFVADFSAVRDVQHVVKNNGVVCIFPEGKMSVDGTTNIMSNSVAKMIKLLNIPIVTVVSYGSYISKPRYLNRKGRFNFPVEARVDILFTTEQIRKLDIDQIYSAVVNKLSHNEYKYQFDNKIEYHGNDICNGLSQILYKCPHCNTEYQMASGGNKLWCNCCHKSYTMDKLGVLTCDNGDTLCDSIPMWNEFQRQAVRQEIVDGTFSVSDNVRFRYISKSRYIDGKKYFMQYDSKGFIFYNEDKTVAMEYCSNRIYTLSFELGKWFYLPDHVNPIRVYPDDVRYIPKLNLAVEEAHKLQLKQ